MPRAAVRRSLGATAALIALTALTLWAMRPPGPVPASAPADAFSAERALVHVREIARAPHPPGTPEHVRVRDYVGAQFDALGLETGVHPTLAIREERRWAIAVPVENVIARRKGARGAGPPLILAAHYDSHPTGPGAGDDAAGVAALLETARALRGATLQNDLLFVITDAEEVGLVGAEGFVADADEAKDRRTVVLNFEARGGGGPVFLFETGEGNAGLMREVAAAVPYPMASSLMYALYKLLPNDTDLSVFKRAGFAGLNFAFVDRWPHYHTALDTADRLDLRSLQQHGEYALSLARRLGDADLAALSDPKQGDAIYFDLFGRLLLRYPLFLAWPLTLAALALYGGTLFRARKDEAFWKAFRASALRWMPLTLLAAGALGYGIGLLAGPTRAGMPNRDPYGIRWGEAGVYLLAATATAALWLRALRHLPLRPLAFGALAWWAIALLAVTALLPGGTYLFLWPFVSAVIVLLPREPRLWQAAGALPTLALWPVILHGLFLLMGYSLTPVFGALAAFALATTLPALATARGALPGLCAVAGIVCLAVGLPAPPPAPGTPRVSTLLHFEDADTGEALWATLDQRSSDWLRPFVPDNASRRPGSLFFPDERSTYRVAPAKRLGRTPPSVSRQGDLLNVSLEPGQRQVVVWTNAPVRSAVLGNRRLLTAGRPLRLRFIAASPLTCFGFRLDAPPGTAVFVDGYTDGLPASVPPRPAGWIPAPVAPRTDVQIVRRTIRVP